VKNKTYFAILGMCVAFWAPQSYAISRDGGGPEKNTNAPAAKSSGSSGSGVSASHYSSGSNANFRSSSGTSPNYARYGSTNGVFPSSGYRGGYRGRFGYGYWPYWSVGAYFSSLPDDYTTYYIDGSPYYYCDGSYFTSYQDGYVVVPAPAVEVVPTGQAVQQPVESVVSVQPAQSSNGPIVINIPNSKGGYTPVKLVKANNGYIGPQGEFYAGHPTMDALRALYGD
jgi:hypothetical protein